MSDVKLRVSKINGNWYIFDHWPTGIRVLSWDHAMLIIDNGYKRGYYVRTK